jgi:hypothetical protein
MTLQHISIFRIYLKPLDTTGCSKRYFTEKPDIKTIFLLSNVLRKLFEMCTHVLAPYPHPALTQKYVSTHLNKFQLGLQFVTKHNYSFLLDKATFGTYCICVARLPVKSKSHIELLNEQPRTCCRIC